MSLLQINQLNLSIHGTPILRDMSFDLDAGQIVGVIGESGSGKSMTAYSVMQLLPEGSHTTGAVRLDGQDLLSLSEKRMCSLRGDELGMVFQEPMTALNPVKNIGDQVAETVRIHRQASRADSLRIARETLDRVEMPAARFPLSRFPMNCPVANVREWSLRWPLRCVRNCL